MLDRVTDLLFTVIALVLVIEGFMPCIVPEYYQKILKRMLELPPRMLRLSGASLMLVGALVLAIIHG